MKRSNLWWQPGLKWWAKKARIKPSGSRLPLSFGWKAGYQWTLSCDKLWKKVVPGVCWKRRVIKTAFNQNQHQNTFLSQLGVTTSFEKWLLVRQKGRKSRKGRHLGQGKPSGHCKKCIFGLYFTSSCIRILWISSLLSLGRRRQCSVINHLKVH